MYIYLDESYNLKDRDKKQFISINGFMTTEIFIVRKLWLRARKPYINRQRIHAHERFFEPLREKAFNIIKTRQVYPVSVFQDIRLIPAHGRSNIYWQKNKLDFELVYTELCKRLLFSLRLNEYKKVHIVIDNRKHKSGIIGKNEFRQAIEIELKTAYPDVLFEKPRLVPSSSDVLLELADFISNSFYAYYQNNEEGDLSEVEIKITQIKKSAVNSRFFKIPFGSH